MSRRAASILQNIDLCYIIQTGLHNVFSAQPDSTDRFFCNPNLVTEVTLVVIQPKKKALHSYLSVCLCV